jgi:NtrC-family two-component system response regulator AlgB
VILSPASVIESDDLGLPACSDGSADPTAFSRSPAPVLGGNFSIAEVEREHIAGVVARLPSFDAAAQVLDIDATTLQRKRKRYGLA